MADAIHAVHQRLSEAFSSGRLSSVAARIDALDRIDRMLARHDEGFTNAVKKDLGRHALETFLAEIYFTRSEIGFIKKNLAAWVRPKKTKSPFFHWPCRSSIIPRPKGPVLNISPWNYPLQLALAPALSAISAGNPVAIKPSEYAGHTVALLSHALHEAGLSGTCEAIPGGPEVGRALLELKWAHVLFTGSKSAGLEVYRKASEHLTPVTLELGGNNPCVADETANIERSALRICAGKFFNAGQTCVAPNVLMVPAPQHDAWVRAMSGAIESFFGKDVESSPDFGRIISVPHAQRLSTFLPPQAIVFGRPNLQGRFVPPAIIPNSTWSDPWSASEIFGPILPIIPYASLEELKKHAAIFSEPLAAYVFSRRRAFVASVESVFQPATMCINDVMKQVANLHLPLGGRGPSGFGRYRGYHGFETFSHLQAVTQKYAFDPFGLKPPYGNKLSFLRKWL